MTYATLEKRLHSLPAGCLDEVSAYIDFLLYREGMRQAHDGVPPVTGDLASHFGAIGGFADGMDMQRAARDEWD